MHCDPCTKEQRGFGHIVRLRLPMVVNCTPALQVDLLDFPLEGRYQPLWLGVHNRIYLWRPGDWNQVLLGWKKLRLSLIAQIQRESSFVEADHGCRLNRPIR